MKRSAFVIFTAVLLIVYFFANWFLFAKGYNALPDNYPYKSIYLISFLFLALPFAISRILLVTETSFQPRLLFEIGGIWLAAVFYFLLAALIVDLLRLSNYFFDFLPAVIPYKFVFLLFIVGLVFILLVIGYLNAKVPRIKTINLEIDKKSNIDSLKIAMVSDVHFGAIIGVSEIKNMLLKIEKEKPDIFIVAGDFFDEGITDKRIEKIKILFDKFNPKFGKIAILGNHEYINNINHTLPIFKKLNFMLLCDNSITIQNSFTIIGRDDITAKSFGGKKRKPLNELMNDVDTELPLILLDHQPFALGDTAKFPIDLQLSGHTHHGQMFPINYITTKAFEKSWGYLKKENTHFYISSGYGTWGPRIRLGNHPEIVIINMNFGKC